MGRKKETPGDLRSFVERIEAVESEKAELADDIKSIYAEAKGAGLDVKALREVIRWRKADADELRQHKETVEEYALALGLLVGTPLGNAALRTVRAMERGTLSVETA